MSRVAFAALLLIAASAALAGCGGDEVSLIDPNKLPPIDANAAATAQSEMDAVADAERAEGEKTTPSKPSRKR